uniref:Fibroblast growth factor 23 n=1 Tax=Sphaeramia orbicularis TaxID=375764 RepID=A0A672ZG44_9TELE
HAINMKAETSIVPIRTQTSNFVSIFDLRRKRFVCMDLQGELYNSRQKDKEGCLFQRIWLDWENHDVFYSTSGGRLLKIEGVELNAPHRGHLHSLRRQKRSDDVNRSDPLGTETHHSSPPKPEPDHGQPERDQAGAVSKETITSCHDPLRVLQSNGSVSPVKTNIADSAEQ